MIGIPDPLVSGRVADVRRLAPQLTSCICLLGDDYPVISIGDEPRMSPRDIEEAHEHPGWLGENALSLLLRCRHGH